MPKKPIIIISVLCVIALALGYWSGQGKEEVASSGDVKSSEKKEPEFLKKGLVAYYPFNGNAKDESGNRVNPVRISDVSFVSDRNGNPRKALNFNAGEVGKNPHVDLGFASKLNYLDQFTISAWIFCTGGVLEPRIIDCASKFGFQTRGRRSRRTLMYRHGTEPDTRRHIHHGTMVIPEEKWCHAVVTVSNNNSTIYVNGLFDSNQSHDKFQFNRETKVVIGRKSMAPSDYFVGQIDDLRVYEHALSADEVKALYEFEKAN